MFPDPAVIAAERAAGQGLFSVSARSSAHFILPRLLIRATSHGGSDVILTRLASAAGADRLSATPLSEGIIPGLDFCNHRRAIEIASAPIIFLVLLSTS